MHPDVEIQKEILNELNQDETDISSDLEAERRIDEAAQGLVNEDYDTDPAENLVEVMESGYGAERAFYNLGVNTRNAIDRQIDNPDDITAAYMKELSENLVGQVDQARKSKVEKFAETMDAISMFGRTVKAAVKSWNDHRDTDSIVYDEISSMNSNIYGVEGSDLSAAFIQGYQQQVGQVSHTEEVGYDPMDGIRASD